MDTHNKIKVEELKVDEALFSFINTEVLPPLSFDQTKFWKSFNKLVYKLTPINRSLISERVRIQKSLDKWHLQHKKGYEVEEYKQFLKDLGYIKQIGPEFKINPKNVDIEVSQKSGPQLVVPIMNARFAINAVNARWGSLYDALYGNDVISEKDGCEKGLVYNPKRGEQVIKYGKEFLDYSAPFEGISHKDICKYAITSTHELIGFDDKSNIHALKNPEKFEGYLGDYKNPSSILLKNNNLYIEIKVDINSSVGRSDKAGVEDIIIESAVTTILDCEDSVAAVDAVDKLLSYKNWLGLNAGSLECSISKNGKSFIRKLASDKIFIGRDGVDLELPGRSLMFVRNVGHLMTNSAIMLDDGSEIFEGIMDAVFTSLISLHDVKICRNNSKHGSIYIVKPKMHGPDEVAFANLLFNECEDLLEISRNTIKIGLMDEEKRTSVNLYECVRQVKDRIVFINTGFLDRTGDEIHTNMSLGAVLPKQQIKDMEWLSTYEKNNVSVGLKTGFHKTAQIGKGMWAKPDLMAEMMSEKIEHLKSGASCAWVPSPTAASLHALHYHQVSVESIQSELSTHIESNIDGMLRYSVLTLTSLSSEEIKREVDNNIQGILGYVVRWIDQGIGCSKVPDINNIGLMEDRATLRISSQLLTNWINNGICSTEFILDSLKKMAKIVDKQNEHDENYKMMSSDYNNNLAFDAAKKLIIDGVNQPNGYTEPLLHEYRKRAKKV